MTGTSPDGTREGDAVSSIRGVVLAGGRSRRFGEENKALATVDGASLLGRAAAAVRSIGTEPPIVAVASERQRGRLASEIEGPVEFVRDDPTLDGPLAGVAAAARAAETDRIAVVGCDMPFVSGDAIRWLARRGPTAAAVVPVDDEGVGQPLHAVYRTDIVSDAAGESLRTVLAELDHRRVPVDTAPSSVSLARSLTNVNTPSELREARSDADGVE